MKIVINTAGYRTGEGFADQITMPNGHLVYTGIGSTMSAAAAAKGYKVKTVRFFGACISDNINDRALLGFPIQIDEVSVADFKDKIATEEECQEFTIELFPSILKT